MRIIYLKNPQDVFVSQGIESSQSRERVKAMAKEGVEDRGSNILMEKSCWSP